MGVTFSTWDKKEFKKYQHIERFGTTEVQNIKTMDIKSKIEEIISNNIEIGETKNRLDYIVHNTSELAEEIVKLFAIHVISQQRELLMAYLNKLEELGYNIDFEYDEETCNEVIPNINCG